MLSLLMQGKPIFQSAHVWTGLIGLACLALNGMLSLFFEEEEGARTAVRHNEMATHSYLPACRLTMRERRFQTRALNCPSYLSL